MDQTQYASIPVFDEEVMGRLRDRRIGLQTDIAQIAAQGTPKDIASLKP